MKPNEPSGQDREGYTDTQDRESYAVEAAGFTPGPWEADLSRYNGHCGIRIYPKAQPEIDIATAYLHFIASSETAEGNVHLPQNQEAVANSRLVAAAPDLLAALQAFVDYHEGDFPYEEDDAVDGRSPEMAQALRAIAAARGQV
mgnify:CR=1 FL=1